MFLCVSSGRRGDKSQVRTLHRAGSPINVLAVLSIVRLADLTRVTELAANATG